MTRRGFSWLIVAGLLMLACGLSETAAGVPGTPVEQPLSERSSSPESSNLPPITLPVVVYILDDEANLRSSARTAQELEAVYVRVNEIWSPAGIEFQVLAIERLRVPSNVLQDLAHGDFRALFHEPSIVGQIPTSTAITAFYAQQIGGPNGVNPGGTRVFLVADEPTVHDERVTAHEIGHILGLHHTLEDPERLIYPGTNGMKLVADEITVARYMAQGILSGTR